MHHRRHYTKFGPLRRTTRLRRPTTRTGGIRMTSRPEPDPTHETEAPPSGRTEDPCRRRGQEDR